MKTKEILIRLFGTYEQLEKYIRKREQLYLKNHPHPTGICYGCGKDMYDNTNICSKECDEVCEIQISGY